MPTPPRTAENEFWYTKRGKRRRPRVVEQPGRDGDNPPRSSRPSEAAGSDAVTPQARRTRAQRPREGHGEGTVEPEDQAELLQHPAKW